MQLIIRVQYNNIVNGHNQFIIIIIITVAGHCGSTGGQVSLTNKIFVINIEFYMKK